MDKNMIKKKKILFLICHMKLKIRINFLQNFLIKRFYIIKIKVLKNKNNIVPL